MKQICKRLSVIFLALTIISGSVLTTGVIVNADTYKEIYKEDFNSYEKKTSGSANANAMKANGWTAPNDTQPHMSNTQGNYNTGSAYELPHNKGASICVANAKNASQWSDYSVQATMTLLPHKDAAGITRAGVTGRQYVVDNNKGYDLVVVKNEVTDQGATIQLRCDKVVLAEQTITKLEPEVAFVLRLEFRGTKLYGYLDNKLMISHDTANDAVKYASGWAGIRKTDSKGYGVRYDDFIVSEIVPGTYPEGYLYYNDFSVSTTLAEAGFYGSSKNKIEDGVYNLNAGTYAYLREVVGSLDWNDYTVEADVKMIKEDDSTITKGYAGIVARSTKSNNEGYEFRMDYNNGTKTLTLTQRIKDKDNNDISTSMADPLDIDFEFNTYHKMTMTVYGDSIMCWFDGILVFDVEDTDAVKYSTGYAGIRSTGNAANLNSKIDNFSVKAYVAPEVVYPDGYFYFNDFETNARLKNEGWRVEGTKTNGTYVLEGGTHNYLTGVKDSDKWTDYVVESEVMLNDNGTLPQYAGIVGRTTSPRENGYELILVKEDTGNTVVRLYKRGVSSGKINDKVHKVNVTWEPSKMNTLKMVLKGADIYCYYNDEIVFEITDNAPYLAGYAGVISASGTATSTYDNYAVREIQLADYPADAVYPQGYLYYNDFSALRAMNKEGWRSAGDKINGAYMLEGGKYNYLTNVEGSKDWTDYVVEVDVTLYDNGEVPQYTAIAARTKNLNNEGYEFRLIKQDDGNTVVRLYKRGVDSGKINDKVNKINVSVIPNEKHNMKMVVEGTTITCYFDGVKMFEVTDKNEPYLTGYAGVHSADGEADSSFEYFAVRQIGDADIVKDVVIKKQDGDIWFFDNFMGEESMSERGWSTDKVAIRNGAAFVTTRVVADRIQDADKWTDYEVSAIVCVDKEAGIHGTATSGATAVVARSLSAASGYEFGILTSGTSTSYLRLLDRKTGLNIGEDKTTKITAGEHELRMVCIGKEIYCYFDGSLVIAAQSDSWTAGYAGMRTANVDSYYKDFTVRKARPVTITMPPSGTVSPVTGDSGVNTAVVYGAALVLSLSIIGFVVTSSYSRKRR